jgi:hypothetical protein
VIVEYTCVLSLYGRYVYVLVLSSVLMIMLSQMFLERDGVGQHVGRTENMTSAHKILIRRIEGAT